MDLKKDCLNVPFEKKKRLSSIFKIRLDHVMSKIKDVGAAQMHLDMVKFIF